MKNRSYRLFQMDCLLAADMRHELEASVARLLAEAQERLASRIASGRPLHWVDAADISYFAVLLERVETLPDGIPIDRLTD